MVKTASVKMSTKWVRYVQEFGMKKYVRYLTLFGRYVPKWYNDRQEEGEKFLY